VAHVHPHHGARAAGVAAVALIALLAAAVTLLVLRDRSSSTSLTGDGIGATQVRSLPPFHEVELAGGGDVRVDVGGTQRVVVRADRNLLGHVTTQVEHGRLLVGTSGSFSTSSPLEVDVTVPRLDVLALSGGGLATAANLDQKRLQLVLSGGGMLSALGKVGRGEILHSGGGYVDASKLEARDAVVQLSGGGSAVVNATETLRAVVSGAGSILYRGSPRHIESDVTGVGSVDPG